MSIKKRIVWISWLIIEVFINSTFYIDTKVRKKVAIKWIIQMTNYVLGSKSNF
jgi:hypothetical protein